MEFYILMLIIGGVTLSFGGAIVLTFYLVKRVRRTGLRVVIITNDKKRKVHKFKQIEKDFDIKGKKYIFDYNAVVKSKNRDWIYFNIDNPKPINFNNPNDGIDASTLSGLMENKLISQLFSSTKDELFSPSMIVMYIVLALNIGIIIYLIVMGSSDVLINNQANKDFIKNTVIEAIK